MLTLGVDPDLHALAVAAWGDEGPVGGTVIRVPASERGPLAVLAMIRAMQDHLLVVPPDAIAVEGQDLVGRRHPRPNDILDLAAVAGAALMVTGLCSPADTSLLFPRPGEWTTVPKVVGQSRLYTDLGWEFERMSDYARPTDPPPGFEGVRPAEWKHVGDALRLALWARTAR